MKRTIVIAAMLSVFAASAQTLQDARTQIDNENYFKAKQILHGLLKGDAEYAPDVYYYLGNAYLKDDDVDSAKIFYKMVFNPDTRTALGYVANGRLALLAKNNAEAKTNFDRAIQTSKGKNATILYEIGDAYFRPNIIDLNAAMMNFDAAFTVDGKNTTIMLAQGDAYLENSLKDPSMGGKAMNKYEAASEINNKLPLAWIKIGRLAVRGHIYNQAIDAYNKAITLDPSYANAYRELGEAYYYTKQFDKTIEYFKKYIDLSPGDIKARTSYLEMLIRNKDYAKVEEEALNGLKGDPNNHIFYRFLIISQYELKRYKDGYENMTKYMQMPDVKPKAIDYIYAARLSSQMNDTTAAMKYFTIALGNDSANCDLLGEYGKVLFLARHYDEAVAQYQMKKEKCGGTLSSLEVFYLGRSYLGIGGDSINLLADTTFGEFISRNPTSPDGYYWRAKTNLKIGKLEDFGSFPYYTKYIEVASSEPQRYKRNLVEAYDYLGAYYFEKDKAKSKENFMKALELDPNDEYAIEMMKQFK